MRTLLTVLVFGATIPASDASAQPVAASRDSLLRAVAAAMRERARPTPDSVVWYAEPADNDAATLAIATGAGHGGGLRAGAQPNCPWATDPGRASATGYSAAVQWLQVWSDSARLAVSLRCANPPGYTHRVYWLERTYRVVRGNSGWVARLEMIAVTAIPHPPPNVSPLTSNL